MATSRGLSQFGRRMTIISDDIAVQVRNVVRKTALIADQVVVLATPVDTGRARANWIASVGSPSGDTVGFSTSGAQKSDARGAANAQPALDQAGGIIANYQLGQSIFLTNNVEYIAFLDAGSSSQRPEGMTAAAVQAAVQFIKGARVIRG